MILARWWARATAVKPPHLGEHRVGVVKWADAAAHPAGWATLEDITATATERVMVSVGYVLPPDTLADHVTIAQDYDPDGDRWNGVTHLPRSQVRSVWFLT